MNFKHNIFIMHNYNLPWLCNRKLGWLLFIWTQNNRWFILINQWNVWTDHNKKGKGKRRRLRPTAQHYTASYSVVNILGIELTFIINLYDVEGTSGSIMLVGTCVGLTRNCCCLLWTELLLQVTSWISSSSPEEF